MMSGLRRYVWDAPTRLFHWSIVVLCGFSWWSAENSHMDWHYKSGLALTALVIFRLLWGVMGSETARFARFVRGPAALAAYFSGRLPLGLGHNPLGGWSVVALLGVLTLQVTTGLFAVDVDGMESGPMSHLVDFDQGRLAAKIHETSFTALQLLVALHVAAILFYQLVRRRNLTRAMITGWQAVSDARLQNMVRAGWPRFGIAVALTAVATYWLANGGRF